MIVHVNVEQQEVVTIARRSVRIDVKVEFPNAQNLNELEGWRRATEILFQTEQRMSENRPVMPVNQSAR